MKPICFPCGRFFRVVKNGFPFVEGKPRVNGAAAGKEHDELWTNYKLWLGDKWRCPGCGAEVIVGAGQRPVAEDYHEDFAEQVRSMGVAFRVNDC